MNSEKELKIAKCVFFDKHTIVNCEKYGRAHGLNFSSVVRLAVNDFFIKLGGC